MVVETLKQRAMQEEIEAEVGRRNNRKTSTNLKVGVWLWLAVNTVSTLAVRMSEDQLISDAWSEESATQGTWWGRSSLLQLRQSFTY